MTAPAGQSTNSLWAHRRNKRLYDAANEFLHTVGLLTTKTPHLPDTLGVANFIRNMLSLGPIIDPEPEPEPEKEPPV
jgi:hypothetical protein